MNKTRARIALALAAMVAAAALSGCSVLDQFLPSSQPVRDAETGELTEEVDNADVFAIRVGDCLNTAALEGTDELPYTEAQYGALAALIAALCLAYPSLSRDRIVGHSDVAPGRKTDPGTAFDWRRLRTLLACPPDAGAS